MAKTMPSAAPEADAESVLLTDINITCPMSIPEACFVLLPLTSSASLRSIFHVRSPLYIHPCRGKRRTILAAQPFQDAETSSTSSQRPDAFGNDCPPRREFRALGARLCPHECGTGDAIRKELPFLPSENVVAEPEKRDTAPACALAVGFARARDKEAICALLPADAVIHDTPAFQRQLASAAEVAGRRDALVTFAIPPTYPSTGFGYLQLGEAHDGVHRVVRFVEKPDPSAAEMYYKSGEYAWNAGMFMWRAEMFLA